MVKMSVKERLDEAHRNTGKGLAKLLLPIAAGAILFMSPAGQRAREAVRGYFNEKIAMPTEYNGTNDIRQVAGYQDKHFEERHYRE